MESFYGGRQGISFIIVKRFDGIDIPKDTSFTVKYFAFDTSENNFILDENNNPIERTNDTYKLYNDWKLHEKDGSSITYKEKEGVFPFQYAEGMVQCFSQGGITTNIVNYGEYVIIDTPNKNDLDNGKVYRRGLDYQNDLGGAEYIGQIIGPTGSSPEIYMDSFTTLVSEGGPQISYENDDIIPGMELDADGQMIFNDAIHSSWVTLRDQFGVVTGCKIGFQFPYHVFSFTAESVNPYTEGELIHRDTENDDQTHPYYSRWKISVPKGIKGDALTNLHIVNGYAKKGSSFYQDPECKILLGKIDIEEDIPIDIEGQFYKEDENIISVPILINDQARYVKKVDTHREILIYKETCFDTEQKKIKYFILGEYNMIKNLNLDDHGILTIDYTHEDTQTYYIRWIKEIKFNPDKGQIIIVYNNEEEIILNPDEEDWIKWIKTVNFDENNGQIILTFNDGKSEILNKEDNQKIKWIKNVSFDKNTGLIKLTFNTGEVQILNEGEEEYIKWIKNINLSPNGDLKVTYNTNESEIVSSIPIKWIENIDFKDNEGIIKVSYNTDPETKISLNQNPIKWLTHATLTNTGEIKIKRNTDPEESEGIVINEDDKIRWIKHDTDTNEYGIKINTDTDENGNDLGEGFGSQKIQITYNTGETHTIGRPINYIIESIITKDRELLDDNYRDPLTGELKTQVAKNNHLLVIYSDPELRASLNANTIWESKKLGYFEQWYDMGEVKGDPGTVKIATTITLEEAENILVDNNKPEDILHDSRYEGWLIAVQDTNAIEEYIILYYYDYEKNKWQKLGSAIAPETTTHPEEVIQIEPVIEEDLSNITLENNGLLFTNKDNVIQNIKQKNDNGFSNPFYFSSFAKYVISTLNSGVNNLEHQLLIGVNKIVEEWVDEEENIHIKTKFLLEESTLEYYILHSILYPQNAEGVNIKIDGSKILFSEDINQTPILTGQDKYGHNTYILKLNELRVYSVEEETIKIVPNILIQEDTLSICTDGIEINATDIYKKQILAQILNNGHRVIQEKIINLI